jgi:Zn-dependent peptidase ImmA (M78 family)/transcriptional regulator with XRE-family HTH domain
MAEQVTGVQTSVLQWARETQGFSIDEVAKRMKRDPAEIAAWESGESAPTYVQLETLAYKVYKRPLAVFFLPQPPSEPDPEQEFRTLPDFDLQDLSPDTRYQIRFAHSLQLSLRELNEGRNPAEQLIFRDITLANGSQVNDYAEQVRAYLGITIETQTAWRSSDLALRTWRNAIEDGGVFVFKHAFKQKEISGFSLLDDEFPVIYLNNSTSKTRQVFSLFHELAHVLFHINGISKFDASYIAQLRQPERRIEIFCNALAAELLMPSADFDAQLREYRSIDERSIERLANRYSVSREVVLRRLLDKGLVSQALYEEKSAEWAAQANERDSSGGNYYATQATYLGERYLKLVLGKHYQGKLTLEQAADYLGVKVKNLVGLEEFALQGGAPA